MKSSSKDCEWNNVTENDMIKLQIIKGIHDKKTCKILLREPDLTLTQCIDRCRAAEQSKIQSQKIEKYEKLNVDDDTYEKDINATERKKQYDCIYCQGSHVKGTRNCPAYGQECFRCKRKNHFAISRICKGNHSEQKVNECLHVVGETIYKVHANLKLNRKPIKFMIDSGATVNVIPATFVKDNKMEHLLKKSKKLDISVYGGKKVRTVGTMRVELINPVNRRKVTASVMVVNEKVQPILSCSLCQKLIIRFNLDQFDLTVSAVECDDLKEQALKDIRKLDIDDSIKGILLEFPDVFEERVGEFEGKPAPQTEPGTVPIQQPIRGVPFALEKQFKQELEKMMRDNIIEKLEVT